MTFQFCELSAATGYATAHYELHLDCDLGEALAIGIAEFIPSPNIDEVTMAMLVSHLDIATKEYQSEHEESQEDDDEYEDEE
jgi:hypothetical protein